MSNFWFIWPLVDDLWTELKIKTLTLTLGICWVFVFRPIGIGHLVGKRCLTACSKDWKVSIASRWFKSDR